MLDAVYSNKIMKAATNNLRLKTLELLITAKLINSNI